MKGTAKSDDSQKSYHICSLCQSGKVWKKSDNENINQVTMKKQSPKQNTQISYFLSNSNGQKFWILTYNS